MSKPTCYKSAYAEKLKDPRWQRKRLEIMERDGFACLDCFADEKPLHVHHCHYEKGNPWDTDSALMMTLCEDCHTARQTLENAARYALGTILKAKPLKNLSLLSFVMCIQNASHDYAEAATLTEWKGRKHKPHKKHIKS